MSPAAVLDSSPASSRVVVEPSLAPVSTTKIPMTRSAPASFIVLLQNQYDGPRILSNLLIDLCNPQSCTENYHNLLRVIDDVRQVFAHENERKDVQLSVKR